MTNLQAVQAALDAYHNGYRHPKQSRLRLSGVYALFPKNPIPSEIEVAGKWPDDYWPNCDSPGVYLVFNNKLDLLYVGKASLTQTVGGRLSEYFHYGPDRGCTFAPGSSWKHNPAFVATIPVSAAFEAPSLEEYLIRELCPAENTVGR
jgi:hypothetical protein